MEGVGVADDLCHDNYEHPLLWCAEKKRLIERRNAEESMRMWRRRKAEEMANKDREKYEYDELYFKHCPWGKPGGGAPNIDVRRRDITAIGLHSTPTHVAPHRLTSLQPCPRYADYFTTPHKKCCEPVNTHHHHHDQNQNHAHHNRHASRLTTHSHTIHHHLRDGTRPVADSTITICGANCPLKNACCGCAAFVTKPDSKMGHVDIKVCYKPPAPRKGRPILEKIVFGESDKNQAAPSSSVHQDTKTETRTTAAGKSPSKKKLTTKLEKPINKEPWGKPGPVRKSWNSPNVTGTTSIKTLGWTNKEMLKELDQDNPVTPAEKHTFRKGRTNKKQLTQCCSMCTCRCLEMINSSANVSPLKLSKKCPPIGKSLHKTDIHAKVDTGRQKMCPRLLRRSTMPENHQQPSTLTENSSSATKTNGIENNGGVELAPLLARRRANNRPLSLSSTDVTKRTASDDRIPAVENLRYLHELNEQISQKRRNIITAIQLDRDLCNQHFQTFERFWGRPGHGAPGEIKQKLNLDYLLYGDQGRLE